MAQNECIYIKGVALDEAVGPEAGYFAALPVVQSLAAMQWLAFRKPVTFFVGENGTGKSTLLEAIAVGSGFNPEGGTVNFNFASKETHSGLHQYLRLRRNGAAQRRDGFFLRAESFYNVATEVDRLDKISLHGEVDTNGMVGQYGGKSLHGQSHGESFMALVQSRFAGNGLYILDEPEAALSPSRQMALLAAIHGLVQNRSQFIISTHSPILMAYPNAEIYELGENGIALTPYEETQHFRITRQFLNAPQKMLGYLLEE